MGRQTQIFLDSEGAAWGLRNNAKPKPDNDIVCAVIGEAGLKPQSVLEIGCADGWRLQRLAKQYQCEAHGIDPAVSTHHIVGRVDYYRGTANSLHLFKPAQFDLVIYGFCLYLCDPEDYFEIAAEGDRVLADGGHILVHDFSTPTPHAKRYKHKDGVLSYKMDFINLWLAHPAYRLALATKSVDEVQVMLAKKNMKQAFPVRG